MKKLILYSFILLLMLTGCRKKNNVYVYVSIPKGADVNRIAKILKKHNIISNEFTFRIIAKLKGKDKMLKSGVYKFKAHSSTGEIIDLLASGKCETVRITIPEGFTLKQIYAVLAKKFGISRTSYLNYTCDQTVLKKYKIKGNSMEGYIFPDTYLFNASASLPDIIDKFIEHFNDVYAAESTQYWHILKKPRYKIIIMASIVQAEAKYKSEMPIIASVYYNRLKSGYRLECDPTVMYAMGKRVKVLTYKDLKIDSPYNTYEHYGLPPGPICNPGRAAIHAAMVPSHTKYLYFVADVNGHHLFAQSLAGQNRNIKKVRRHRKSLRR